MDTTKNAVVRVEQKRKKMKEESAMEQITKNKDFTLLHTLTVRNSDDKKQFTDMERLFKISEALEDSPFQHCVQRNLFQAYSQVPFGKLPRKILAVSTHVDFKKETQKCFSDESDAEFLVGTYDNSITNTAMVTLMKEAKLPKNLVVVFTGDEEESSGGADEFSDYVRNELNRKVKCIVLDVTEDGYDADAAFTIENDCWKKGWGRKILTWASAQSREWRYVPYGEENLSKKLIKELVPDDKKISEEADVDETSAYYEDNSIRCFSFCLPAGLEDPEGKHAPGNSSKEAMHSADGLRVSKENYWKYLEALREVILVSAGEELQ